jgi:hypothetical protein
LETAAEAAEAAEGGGPPAPPAGTADLLTKDALTVLDAATTGGTEATAARSAARFSFLLFLDLAILYSTGIA